MIAVGLFLVFGGRFLIYRMEVPAPDRPAPPPILRDWFGKAGLKLTINVSPGRYNGCNSSGWYLRNPDAVWIV